jgi:competence protein ComEC
MIMRSSRVILGSLFVLATVAFSLAHPLPKGTLDIYFIDVEGGQATLLVTEQGGSLLIDTGYKGLDSEHPNIATGRDARRILHAAQDAGIKRIDSLLATHDHPDHMGNILEIQKLIPIGQLIDHGPSAEDREALNVRTGGYPLDWLEALKKASHRVIQAGDKIQVKGMDDITVVLSMDIAISKRGELNPYCENSGPAQPYTTWGTRGAEDRHSAGVVVTYGQFTFANLGDNGTNEELKLLCPENKLGRVDVYETPSHGRPPTAALAATGLRAAVMDNSARKGGTGVKQFQDLPSKPAVWMLHSNLAPNAVNVSEPLIANIAEKQPEDQGMYLKLSAKRDGSFTMFNERTGQTKDYQSRADSKLSTSK